MQSDARHPLVICKLDALRSQSSLDCYKLREASCQFTAFNLLHRGKRYNRLAC